MVSAVIFSFIETREVHSTSYEDFVPLLRKWIDAEQNGDSLDIAETHATGREQASSPTQE